MARSSSDGSLQNQPLRRGQHAEVAARYAKVTVRCPSVTLTACFRPERIAKLFAQRLF